MMRPRPLAGVALAVLGVVMIFSPLVVADLLGRPASTPSEAINLRATWGGTGLGLGAFAAWLPAARPWRRFALGLIGWTMASIALARALGFVLDGNPNALQWVWLVAEIVIAAGCVLALRRG
ncbi:MAG: DUF4345 family protein [Polyangiaceae bacterium]|nr:DUF4345 family protein [Polyangiaceae bacterium]